MLSQFLLQTYLNSETYLDWKKEYQQNSINKTASKITNYTLVSKSSQAKQLLLFSSGSKGNVLKSVWVWQVCTPKWVFSNTIVTLCVLCGRWNHSLIHAKQVPYPWAVRPASALSVKLETHLCLHKNPSFHLISRHCQETWALSFSYRSHTHTHTFSWQLTETISVSLVIFLVYAF